MKIISRTSRLILVSCVLINMLNKTEIGMFSMTLNGYSIIKWYKICKCLLMMRIRRNRSYNEPLRGVMLSPMYKYGQLIQRQRTQALMIAIPCPISNISILHVFARGSLANVYMFNAMRPDANDLSNVFSWIETWWVLQEYYRGVFIKVQFTAIFLSILWFIVCTTMFCRLYNQSP